MDKIVFKVLSYMFAFVLGMYVVFQFKCNHPIEFHRWVITSMFFIFTLRNAK